MQTTFLFQDSWVNSGGSLFLIAVWDFNMELYEVTLKPKYRVCIGKILVIRYISRYPAHDMYHEIYPKTEQFFTVFFLIVQLETIHST